MNRSIKKILTVVVVALMISLAVTTMSRAGRINTSVIINDDIAEPNDIPEEAPEMVPGISWINVICQDEDPNEIPEEAPEMVPNI